MELAEQFEELVSAAFAGIWVRTNEQHEAMSEIAKVCSQKSWQFSVWDIDQGMTGGATTGEDDSVGPDPLAAVRWLRAIGAQEQPTVLVLRNFHRFLASVEIMQALSHQLQRGKSERTYVVILAPIVDLPAELEKEFVVVEHALPAPQQLEEIAQQVAVEDGELPSGDALDAVINAASGMTRNEAESAFALALIRDGRLTAETIWSLKGQALSKGGLLTLYRGRENFEQIGGLSNVKQFCLAAMRQGNHESALRRPKGILLLGVPGSGKSLLAKCLSNEVGRPAVMLDVGALLGSLVGQSERNLRSALHQIDALGSSVVVIDEIEKALAGSSGQGDSGVSTRLLGSLLTWLNDRPSNSFVVCTANNISQLPPELTRSERFDAVFFLDVPGQEDRDRIWQMYLEKYELESQPRPDSDGWTGAEIASCCRLSALLQVSLVEAAAYVVPISQTAAEQIQALRSWASGRCIAADRPGTFVVEAERRRMRRVMPRPSSN